MKMIKIPLFRLALLFVLVQALFIAAQVPVFAEDSEQEVYKITVQQLNGSEETSFDYLEFTCIDASGNPVSEKWDFSNTDSEPVSRVMNVGVTAKKIRIIAYIDWDGTETKVIECTVPFGLYKSESVSTVTENWGEITFCVFSVESEETNSIEYVDAKGGDHTCKGYTPAPGTNGFTMSDGWYALTSSIDYSERIIVAGDANMILCDGCKLNSPKGIQLTAGSSLTIWQQKNGTGELIAGSEDGNAAIGSNKNQGENLCGTLEINGGKITAEAGKGGAGIGGGQNCNSNTITINNGTITARGYSAHPVSDGGAGIGGGYGGGQQGKITINGGTVNAYGGDKAAGIGGGAYSGGGGFGGEVEINDGEVNAYGGWMHGAGIGGGDEGKNGPITINGGKVRACVLNEEEGSSAKMLAAAIGSGAGKDQGDPIVIKGGEVTAENDGVGAAIGASATHNAGVITIINVSKLDAVSSEGTGIGGGGGLGSGEGGSCGSIVIKDSTVCAIALGKSAGIGGGGGTGSITIDGGEVLATGGYKNYKYIREKDFDFESQAYFYMDDANYVRLAQTALMIATHLIVSDEYGGAGIGGGFGSNGVSVNIINDAIVIATAGMQETSAIGHGRKASGNGTLSLYDNAQVTYGHLVDNAATKDVNDDVKVEIDAVTTGDDRVEKCQSRTYVMIEPKPHEHELEHIVAVPAGCETEGNIEYWHCSGCGKYYSDSKTENEITLESARISPLGHNWGEVSYTWSEDSSTVTARRVCRRDESHEESETAETTAEVTQEATCESEGKTTYTAEFKNEAFESQSKTVSDIKAKGHDWSEWSVTKEATENEEGQEIRTCSRDPEHTDTRPVPKLNHVHNLSRVEEVEASCTKSGHKAYYECSGCNAWYEDSDGMIQTSGKEVLLTPTGHHEGKPEKGDVTAATCSLVGGYNLITKCRDCQTVLKTERVIIPVDPDAHDWGEVSYTWSEDNSTVTARRVCRRDESHEESETVKTTAEVTQEATCESEGKTTYTAEFKNEAFETQSRIVNDIDARGHDWGEWEVTKEATEKEDGVETRACRNDPSHTETRSIPASIAYRNVFGDGNIWYKGSNDTSDFVFKRSIDDASTIDHFTGILVDDKAVGAANYIKESGSVIVKLKPEYLETLALGEHTLTAQFDDGNSSASASFIVAQEEKDDQNDDQDDGNSVSNTGNDKNSKNGVRTGDETLIVLWTVFFAGSLLLLLLLLIMRRVKLRR